MGEDVWECWTVADVAREAEFLAQGICYYATEVNGVRYIAPFGSPSLGAPIETVLASATEH